MSGLKPFLFYISPQNPDINAGVNRLWLSTRLPPILQVGGDKNMKDGMGFSPDSIIFIDERLFFLILNFYSTVIIQSLPLPTKFAVEP
jgi:hypothetical protein